MLGHLRMVGEDDISTVLSMSDYSCVFIAELRNGCSQVLHLVHHNMIYPAAPDFWRQALWHSATRFCSTATDNNSDGSILPKHTSEFCSRACAKYDNKHSVPLPVMNI